MASSGATPDLAHYSKGFQAKAADEMEALPQPCANVAENPQDCSAIKTLVLDYGHMRKQTRCLQGDDEACSDTE